MLKYSLGIMVLVILFQVFSKSKNMNLFLPIFFTLLTIVPILLKTDFGLLTIPYIIFLLILWIVFMYKRVRIFARSKSDIY